MVVWVWRQAHWSTYLINCNWGEPYNKGLGQSALGEEAAVLEILRHSVQYDVTGGVEVVSIAESPKIKDVMPNYLDYMRMENCPNIFLVYCKWSICCSPRRYNSCWGFCFSRKLKCPLIKTSKQKEKIFSNQHLHFTFCSLSLAVEEAEGEDKIIHKNLQKWLLSVLVLLVQDMTIKPTNNQSKPMFFVNRSILVSVHKWKLNTQEREALPTEAGTN